MIAISSQPLPTLGPLHRLDKLVDSTRAGYVLGIALDGTVLSCQPDGSIAWRPAGTDGIYEQAMVNGENWLVFAPHPDFPPYAFALFQDIPSTS